MIPKVIHKVILDGVTPKPLSSFISANPGYEVKVYNTEDCEEYILKNFSEKTLKLFQKLKPHAFKVDFFVSLVLYNEGGWYSEAGQYAVESFDLLCVTGHAFYMCNSDGKGLCTDFFGCIPKHPVFKKLIELTKLNIRWSHYGTDPLRVTGANAFMEAVVDFIDDSFCIGKYTDDGFVVFKDDAIIKHTNMIDLQEAAAQWSQKDMYH